MDENDVVRKAAKEALEKIDKNWNKSEGAKAYIPMLAKALSNKDINIRILATETLAKIGDTLAIEPLVMALEDKEWEVRELAIAALENIDPTWRTSEEVTATVLSLIEVLKDKDTNARFAAVVTLGQLGAKQALEPLLAALKDKDTYVQKAAVEALERIDIQDANEAVQQFKEQLSRITPPVPRPSKSVLRSRPISLSVNKVKSMIYKHNFFVSYLNETGKGIKNQLEEQVHHGEKVVVDYKTGLMWQQSYSPEELIFKDAQKWIENLNSKSYAGYNDWRLPTLEEAMSLMRPKQNKFGVYIPPKFECQKWDFWTSDLMGKKRGWVIIYGQGGYAAEDLDSDASVRAVRSMT